MEAKLVDEMAGQRGPADHGTRDKILREANLHFCENGYGATTVAELARAIGVSKAYIYRFFESKQAIGMAVCSQIFQTILDRAGHSIEVAENPTAKLRSLFKSISNSSSELFFDNREFYDICIFAHNERWPVSVTYQQKIQDLLKDILLEGRKQEAFERKTPQDELCRSITLAMQPFTNPLMLQYNLEDRVERLTEATNLVLRSLAP
ncbi:TetR/AcrR family transcriptional regulator [Pseudomonas sp. NPDC090203]|uniref:TetR/AcrR family transcriptional regulator n=1 Tax=Pseudomonas sp. NPDC090203 TaxID=3364477 RepID=UPI0037F2600B